MSTTVTIISGLRPALVVAPSCLCKSGGAMGFGFAPRRRFGGHGMVRMVCVRASGGESPHTLLGVEQGASKKEIKTAYRKLAKQYHPDVCRGDDCSMQFQLINSAYEALMSGMAMPASPSMSEDELDPMFVDPNADFLDELEDCWAYKAPLPMTTPLPHGTMTPLSA